MIGKLIRDYRQDMRWTQAELAERVGVDAGLISRIENDVQPCSIKTLVKLMEVFGLTDDEREVLIDSIINELRQKIAILSS